MPLLPNLGQGSRAMVGFKNDEWTEFVGTIEAHSAKAIFFCASNWAEAQWLPRSQIEIISIDEEATPKEATIHVKTWLVNKNGWEK